MRRPMMPAAINRMPSSALTTAMMPSRMFVVVRSTTMRTAPSVARSVRTAGLDVLQGRAGVTGGALHGVRGVARLLLHQRAERLPALDGGAARAIERARQLIDLGQEILQPRFEVLAQ